MVNLTDSLERVKNPRDLVVVEFLKNKQGIQVLTDSGWSKFEGLLIKDIRPVKKIELAGTYIKTTPDHQIYDGDMNKRSVESIKEGDVLYTSTGIQKVIGIQDCDPEVVYDLLNVENNHRFYANDVLCSNCDFVTADETLINSMKLLEMQGSEPTERQGQVRWYQKPLADRLYLVALDPSLGTGGDMSAIEVFEVPTMIQIAEWQHNRTPIQKQIQVLKEIVKQCSDFAGATNVYYSVENNTLGEAALVSISEIGEENIAGVFLSEPASLGHARRHRKGFTTTSKSKLAACAKLKSLVENDRITITSKNLISELKTFISSGVSFAAKHGETDDLVMALMLVVRMSQVLKNYYPELEQQISDRQDEIIKPMPFIAVF